MKLKQFNSRLSHQAKIPINSGVIRAASQWWSVEHSLWRTPFLSRFAEDSLQVGIRPKGSSENSYFLRRLLMTRRVPDSKANALIPDPASISGTPVAKAAPDIPMTSNIIPTIFM